MCYSQSTSIMDSLWNIESDTLFSQEIINSKRGMEIIGLGTPCLLELSKDFSDTTSTNVYSKCLNRTLLRGEVAIILADRIEGMPYYRLTQIQNCLLDYCKQNPNLIEYYLDAIQRDNLAEFQDRYITWLQSEERIEWIPLIDYMDKKERKQETKRKRKEYQKNKDDNKV